MRNFKNTAIEVVHRQGDKDWDKTGRYLSIRAYKNGQDFGPLHMGPDIPIESELSDLEIERIVSALLAAVADKVQVQ